jgi:hypothetical protein
MGLHGGLKPNSKLTAETEMPFLRVSAELGLPHQKLDEERNNEYM